MDTKPDTARLERERELRQLAIRDDRLPPDDEEYKRRCTSKSERMQLVLSPIDRATIEVQSEWMGTAMGTYMLAAHRALMHRRMERMTPEQLAAFHQLVDIAFARVTGQPTLASIEIPE